MISVAAIGNTSWVWDPSWMSCHMHWNSQKCIEDMIISPNVMMYSFSVRTLYILNYVSVFS